MGSQLAVDGGGKWRQGQEAGEITRREVFGGRKGPEAGEEGTDPRQIRK